MSITTFKSSLETIVRDELDSNPSGILYSKRRMPLGAQLDDNLFFTLSGYLLHSKEKTELSKALKKSCSANLDFYKNKEGKSSYNFWKTKPYTQFPNSIFLSRIKHFWVADDLDCSALSHFILEGDSEIEKLRRISANFVSGKESKIGDHALPIGVFSTWFGSNMKAEVDVCVLANYLTVLTAKNVPLCNADLKSLQLIKSCMNLDFTNKHSYELSPNYQKASVISFHLARCVFSLIEMFSNEELDRFNNQLNQKFKESKSIENKIMYALALIEMQIPVRVDVSEEEMFYFIENFSFFQAPMLSNSKYTLAQKLKARKLFNVSFISRGFNALILLKIIYSE